MEARYIHFVSGDWISAGGQIRIRIETANSGEPQDFLLALNDISALVTLLLVLGKQAAGVLADTNPHEFQTVTPIPVDAVSAGEASDGQALLQVEVGQTALAFAFPKDAMGQLGQSLLALSATAETGSA